MELKRWMRGVTWAFLVGAVLFGADRLLFGPSASAGWNAAVQLADIPEQSGRPVIPPYLPNSLVWPPEEYLYRLPPEPGWWLGLADKRTQEIWLWYGTGARPLPEQMKSLESCFDETTMASCPPGWRIASTQIAGATVYVLTRLQAQETKRIIVGFSLPSS
ncbi:MAG TPA: hypothetical protein DCS07_08345 [Bdellovibrionales bacterium]|nr:MAG: hypothetical protein A2Z97_07765 [Bdellovibrionales bacterium GWB1_52_6]OFZ04775.1 MAG: hypothetical protein A2X97_13705 [Bdellovibrionales bacterium GWA1_52_35]OFZ40347.1 MAG: hypothetical protein A2070_10535 [Bdellovibrionales bacterium GWC1_52_8]HAR42624.1 hypothetical protein [Bdellovibrionales bacterium]HCM39590.1 hypothetical protein [Bdellovibrionales bacterium]